MMLFLCPLLLLSIKYAASENAETVKKNGMHA